MAIHRLSLSQWNIHSNHYLLLLLLYVGAPLWPLLWSSSRASLSLQEQRCQSLEFTSPARGLPSFEWTEAHGCPCGWARCCWDSICLRSQFTLIILVSPCFHACFSRKLGFINTNMFLHWQLSQHESHISGWHLIQPLPSSLRWWHQKPPHPGGLLTAIMWFLLS